MLYRLTKKGNTHLQTLSFTVSKQVQHELLCYPKQNGVVERMNQTLVEIVHSVLSVEKNE